MTPNKRHKKKGGQADAALAVEAAGSAQTVEADGIAEATQQPHATEETPDTPDATGEAEDAAETPSEEPAATADAAQGSPADELEEDESDAAQSGSDDSPAVEPPEEQPTDAVLASLEELDARERVSGASMELVEQLEFAAVPKARRGAKSDERDAPLELESVAEARSIIEAFLFTTNEPLSVARISKLMNNLHPRTVRGLLLELQMEYDRRGGALQVAEVAGGFQMATRPQQADWLLRLHKHRRRSPLSPATLETLAIISYKQPVTKAEIEVIRGVETTAPLYTLQDIGLIEVSGRREVIGRPQLYVTTEMFLKTFGLRSLSDLPSITELKHLFAEEQRLKMKPAVPAEGAIDDAQQDGSAQTADAEEGGESGQESVGGAEEIDLDGGGMDAPDEEADLGDADAPIRRSAFPRRADDADAADEELDDEWEDAALVDGVSDDGESGDELSDDDIEAALANEPGSGVTEDSESDTDSGESRQE